MINQIFGIYKVLKKNEELSKLKQHSYWTCECIKCGAIQDVRIDGLKKLPQNCSNCKHNLIGQRFGRLIVLNKDHVDNCGHIMWKCQCDCGNQVVVNSSNLKRGLTQSCGCLHQEKTSEIHLKDLTGKIFGQLTVIKRVSPIGESPVRWLCQCSCGTQTIVRATNLVSKHTQSCGCVHSLGEAKIRLLLQELNIPFRTEYTFAKLPKRRFDFYLPTYNVCIEYDGKQHFEYINTWHQTTEEFKAAQLRDIEKTKFCQEHHIPLLRIGYQQYDELDKNFLFKQITGIIKDSAINADVDADILSEM